MDANEGKDPNTRSRGLPPPKLVWSNAPEDLLNDTLFIVGAKWHMLDTGPHSGWRPIIQRHFKQESLDKDHEDSLNK